MKKVVVVLCLIFAGCNTIDQAKKDLINNILCSEEHFTDIIDTSSFKYDHDVVNIELLHWPDYYQISMDPDTLNLLIKEFGCDSYEIAFIDNGKFETKDSTVHESKTVVLADDIRKTYSRYNILTFVFIEFKTKWYLYWILDYDPDFFRAHHVHVYRGLD